MDLGGLFAVVATAILFSGLFMMLTRSARKGRMEMIEIGKSNTKAVEECTACIKELIKRPGQTNPEITCSMAVP